MAVTFGDSHRRLVAAAVGIAVVCVVAFWPMWHSETLSATINLLVVVSFVATGVALWDDPSQHGNARALVLCGVLYLVSWLNAWQIGLFPLLSDIFGDLWFVAGALALLRYPDRTLAERSERCFMVVLGIWAGLLPALAAVFSLPRWHDFESTVWWVTFYPDRRIADWVASVFDLGVAVAAGILLVLLIRRFRRIHGMYRVDSIPVTVAAGCVAIGGGTYMIANLLPHSDQSLAALLNVIGVCSLATPIAFLTTVLRRRLVRASVADLVLGLSSTPSVAGVQEALREALRDPTLRMLLWLPTQGVYVDEQGTAVRTPLPADNWSVPVQGRDATPLAVLLVDPGLRRHQRLVESAAVASSLSLENGRLRADLEAQLAEVQASRAWIVAAAVTERRRLERDLHDGVQQSLLAAAASLTVARIHATRDTPVVLAMDRARDDLRIALRDLRRLARGIHPAVLSQSGLRPAIEGVAERLPMSVELRLTDRRWSPSIESTVYFLVCEALANVVKHASATSASVSVDGSATGVVVRVSDDGRGGAALREGGGLAGIADRVLALGGTFDLIELPDGGTEVEARIRCE
jgi:signal transduction histidine kinase